MDKIEFRIIQITTERGLFDCVEILINNNNLIELLTNHEMPFALKEGSKEIAGDYAGYGVYEFLRILTNPGERDIDENGKDPRYPLNASIVDQLKE